MLRTTARTAGSGRGVLPNTLFTCRQGWGNRLHRLNRWRVDPRTGRSLRLDSERQLQIAQIEAIGSTISDLMFNPKRSCEG
jgi:hypothetical protein